MTTLRAFRDAVRELHPEAPDEADTMRLAQPAELVALWNPAGLAEVATGELVVAAPYVDFQDYWSLFPEGDRTVRGELSPAGRRAARR